MLSVDSSQPQRSSSQAALIALWVVNLIPIWGVFFRDWSVHEIVAIYWIENVTVGIVNLLKLLTNRNERTKLPQRLFLSAFFAVHYGAFCAGHATFVFGVLGGEDSSISANGLGETAWSALMAYPVAFAGFLLSHLFSFVLNYHGKGEAEHLEIGKVMFLPYSRIVILHLTIIFGALAIEALGNPKALILVLVAAKTIGDVILHKREHRSLEMSQSV